MSDHSLIKKVKNKRERSPIFLSIGIGIICLLLVITSFPNSSAEIRSVLREIWHSIKYQQIVKSAKIDYAIPSSSTNLLASSPLRVSSSNSRYFTDANGKAILLVGDHTWYTLQDGGYGSSPPVFDYFAYLNFLQANNINFFRFFVWEQSRCSELVGCDWYYDPSPYQRKGPGNAYDGKPKFDLTQFDQAYFDRLRERVIEAGQRGIYVSIQLFDGFSVVDKGYGPSPTSPWPGHPFNKNNNVNDIDGDPNNNNEGEETQTLSIPEITSLEEAYVKKVIDTVNDLDNVLYEICNESNGGNDETQWQNYMIDLIHDYEAGKPKQHPVGFTVQWPGGNNSDLFASNADWISPNADGGYYDEPPPTDGAKVILNDTDHLCYPCGDRNWMWKSVMRGYNPAFMDPYDCQGDPSPSGCDPNDPDWVSLRKNLGYALAFSKRMNLDVMIPHGELSSTGYALANPSPVNGEYLVYLPFGGTVTIDLSATPGTLIVEWLNSETGETTFDNPITGGKTVTLTPPFDGDGVLYLYGYLSPILYVNKDGTGSGTITSVPEGIDCGIVCSANFDFGETVVLSATPGVESSFISWSGACSGSNRCTITMTETKSVTATFSLNRYSLTVDRAGTGNGRVTSIPPGIDCGNTCTADYDYDTKVSLSAIPTIGSIFTGWEGACSGQGICSVTMTNAQSITAVFTISNFFISYLPIIRTPK